MEPENNIKEVMSEEKKNGKIVQKEDQKQSED